MQAGAAPEEPPLIGSPSHGHCAERVVEWAILAITQVEIDSVLS